jgi:hypothetical protein
MLLVTEANPKQAALITLRALRNFGEVSGQKVSLAKTKAAGSPKMFQKLHKFGYVERWGLHLPKTLENTWECLLGHKENL